MSENLSRPLRKVGIADHLWETFEQMALEMGTDRDGLINQALFSFARQNGFLNGGAAPAARVEPEAAPAIPTPAPQPARRPTIAPSGRVDPASVRGSRDPDSASRRGAAPAPPPPDAFADDHPPRNTMDSDPERVAVAQRVLETAAELESFLKNKSAGEPAAAEASGESVVPSAGLSLYLTAEGHDSEKITKDRYLIGRGKHCDMIINSGKVSREHAAIVRDGADWYVQDLDSSNGTWFNKQRIKRRKIENGDEFFICSDKVKFSFR